MNCTCKTDLEARLLTRFKESSPEASDHKVSLKGYAFIIQRDKMVTGGYQEVDQRAAFPLKNGGFKERKVQMNMNFSYCPYCGIKA